jgi:hypothetical protein
VQFVCGAGMRRVAKRKRKTGFGCVPAIPADAVARVVECFAASRREQREWIGKYDSRTQMMVMGAEERTPSEMVVGISGG